MLSIAPGIALIVAAVLLVVVALGARLSPPPVTIGAGAFRALFVGAAALVVLGGTIDLRSAQLRAAESGGVELASWMEQDPAWLLLTPVLALGMAILAVALRQLLRGKVQGAAGWVGLVLLAAGLGLEEASGHVWLDPTERRVHIRRGSLFVRADDAPMSAVEEVRIHVERVRGAPMSRVRLAGAALPESIRGLGYDSYDAHLARLEAARWAAAGGWAIREDEAAAEVGGR